MQENYDPVSLVPPLSWGPKKKPQLQGHVKEVVAQSPFDFQTIESLALPPMTKGDGGTMDVFGDHMRFPERKHGFEAASNVSCTNIRGRFFVN